MPSRPIGDLAARLRGAATAPPPSLPVTPAEPAPPPARAPAPRAQGRRSKFTVLLDQEEAADFANLAADCRRRLGRRVDQSEILRAWLRVTRRDVQVLAALVDELAARTRPA